MRTFWLITLLILVPASAWTQPPVIQYYIEATQAREAGDYDGYVTGMQKALAEIPGHSILLRHIAQGHALAGRPTEAIEVLADVAATGAWFDLDHYEEFAALKNEAGFRQVVYALASNKTPWGEATTAITIDDPMLIPEGITYDPIDDVFFLSSLHQRKIIEVTRNGAARDFVTGHREH